MKNYISALIRLIAIMLIIGLIVLWIYVLAVYGNKPITEVPTWALWLLHS